MLFALFLWLLGVVWAAPMADVRAESLDLTPYVQLAEDPSGTLTRSELSWHDGDGSIPTFGVSDSAWWARVVVNNPTGRPVSRIFAVGLPTIERLELHLPSGVVHTGRARPAGQRPIRRRDFAAVVVFPPGRTEIALRARTGNPLSLPLTLSSVEAQMQRDARLTLVTATYGVLLALGLAHLLLAVFGHERPSAWLASRLLFGGFWLSLVDGTASLYWPAAWHIPNTLVVICSFGAAISAWAFAEVFLDMPKSSLHRRALRGMTWCWLILAPFAVFVLPHGLVNVVSFSLLMPTIAVVLWGAAAAARQGRPEGWWLLLVYLALGVLLTVFMLWMSGRSAFFISLNSGPTLIFVTEGVLLTLATADAARRRRQRANALHEASIRFVPRRFLAALGHDEIADVRLGDQVEREMTIWFSDIRNFTATTERLDSAQAFEWVNQVLGTVEPIVTRHGGFVDKYIGDAVMALFDEPSAAVAAAREVTAALATLDPPVRMGIGLHHGPLTLGTVGSAGRLSCTVLGDAVNLTSRIESLTKQYGVAVLMSEAIATRIDTPTERVDRVQVKGREQPVEIYTLP